MTSMLARRFLCPSLQRVVWPLAALGLFASTGSAQQGDGTNQAVRASVFKPAKVEPTRDRLLGIKAPPGFEVSQFATGLKNARILAVAPDGTVYVSRREQGDVLMSSPLT